MSHDHSHGHAHDHAPKTFGTAFAIGSSLNTIFVIAEFIFGIRSHSLALVADAGHNLADVLGLLAAWGATILARRAPTTRHTYGMRSSSILAALFNASLLLVGIGAIAWESIGRFSEPQSVDAMTVVWVAALGVLINGATALLFFSGRKDDLNIKGAFLHMAADTAVSVGVIVAALAIRWTGLLWIDPTLSLIICVVISIGTWSLLKDSVNLSLHAVPSSIELTEVQDFLCKASGVCAVHDLHIWALSTTDVALTAHVVFEEATLDEGLFSPMSHLRKELKERFGISHVTIQLELPGNDCGKCAGPEVYSQPASSDSVQRTP
jgi:cobalt-zinc-cadmium efflux system protein